MITISSVSLVFVNEQIQLFVVKLKLIDLLNELIAFDSKSKKLVMHHLTLMHTSQVQLQFYSNISALQLMFINITAKIVQIIN